MKIALGLTLGMIALSSQGSPDYVTSSKTMQPNIPMTPNLGPGIGQPIPPMGNYPPMGGYPQPPMGGYPQPPLGGYPVPPIAGPDSGYPIPPIGNIPVPPIAGPGIGGPINPPTGGFFPGCKVSGYHRHLCMITTDPDVYDPNTPYDPSYRCLRNAVCKYKGGVCRWVRTEKYQRCMYNLRYQVDPHNNNGMF